ncbi:hypothetical protein EYR36_002081 [Pleurotus pulmonarius]|nr:hypothetical protein EYR36_002081 [Pleurotus pulmonarius]KAF4588180.1 hypothetical protein EYR38_010147 [Pleurotus pulmonarius]
MFFHPLKLGLLFIAFFAFAVATPVLETRGTGTDLCPNGKKTMCCGGLETYSRDALGLIVSLLTTSVSIVEEVLSATGLVGLKCTPISLLGGIGISDVCKTNGVCCSDIELGGVISAGCSPIVIL